MLPSVVKGETAEDESHNITSIYCGKFQVKFMFLKNDFQQTSTGTTYFSQRVIEGGGGRGVGVEQVPLVGIHGNLVLPKHAVMTQL